jgi:hypothetical protein
MNRIVVPNILCPSLMISPISRGYSVLHEHRMPQSCFAHFLTMLKDNWIKKILQICCDNGGEYISNEFKDFLLTSRVFHELIPHYSAESHGIA